MSPVSLKPSNPKSLIPNPSREGWQGWDEYAPFYDWENAQTLGRRDVPFWTRVAARAQGPVLELGCGTGRVTRPLAKAGIDVVGIDRSPAMLERLQIPSPTSRIPVVRGDIRALPFADAAFPMVIAPYGILQSLIRARDLAATLASVARVVKPGGTFGIDLVPERLEGGFQDGDADPRSASLRHARGRSREEDQARHETACAPRAR